MLSPHRHAEELKQSSVPQRLSNGAQSAPGSTPRPEPQPTRLLPSELAQVDTPSCVCRVIQKRSPAPSGGQPLGELWATSSLLRHRCQPDAHRSSVEQLVPFGSVLSLPASRPHRDVFVTPGTPKPPAQAAMLGNIAMSTYASLVPSEHPGSNCPGAPPAVPSSNGLRSRRLQPPVAMPIAQTSTPFKNAPAAHWAWG